MATHGPSVVDHVDIDLDGIGHPGAAGEKGVDGSDVLVRADLVRGQDHLGQQELAPVHHVPCSGVTKVAGPRTDPPPSGSARRPHRSRAWPPRPYSKAEGRHVKRADGQCGHGAAVGEETPPR